MNSSKRIRGALRAALSVGGLTGILLVASLVAAASASAAWTELGNNSGLTANREFDSTTFDGSIYTASAWSDGFAEYGFVVTKSPLAGPQETQYHETYSPFEDPIDPNGGFFAAAKLFVHQDRLCLVVARDPFGDPVGDYVLRNYCLSGGAWSAFGPPTELAALNENAQPNFCVTASDAGPQMIFSALDGTDASFESARLQNGVWLATGDTLDSFDATSFISPKCAVASVAEHPYAATSSGSGDEDAVKVSSFESGHWQASGDPLVAPAGRAVVDFDITDFGGRPALAWASGAAPLNLWPPRTNDDLYFSRQLVAGDWQVVSGDLNGDGSTVESVAAESISDRPAVAWSDSTPAFDDDGFETFPVPAMRAVTGPFASAPTGPWSEVTGGDTLSSAPDAVRYRVGLTSAGAKPVVAYTFLEASPRDQFPVGLVVGDAIAGPANSPPAVPMPSGNAQGTGVPAPVVKPKPKVKKKRVCKRSKRTHRVKCRHVVVKQRR